MLRRLQATATAALSTGKRLQEVFRPEITPWEQLKALSTLFVQVPLK